MNYANILPTFFKVFMHKNNPALSGNKAGLLTDKDGLSDGNLNVWGGDGGDDSLGV